MFPALHNHAAGLAKPWRLCLGLLLVLLVAWPAEALAVVRVYLVAVGIADYPGDKNDLTLPAADARTIQKLYRQNTRTQTVLLLNDQATRAAILEQMKTLFASAGADDIVVFFFSGHGARGGLVAYDGVLTYGTLHEVFKACPCKNKMIFADACFSGKMRHGKKPAATPNLNDSHVMLFLSSRDDETSIERRSMKNGLFTSCLERCLRGGADANRDRIITARELFDGVSKGVIRLSKDRQHPVMWGRFDDDMPVMVWEP